MLGKNSVAEFAWLDRTAAAAVFLVAGSCLAGGVGKVSVGVGDVDMVALEVVGTLMLVVERNPTPGVDYFAAKVDTPSLGENSFAVRVDIHSFVDLADILE